MISIFIIHPNNIHANINTFEETLKNISVIDNVTIEEVSDRISILITGNKSGIVCDTFHIYRSNNFLYELCFSLDTEQDNNLFVSDLIKSDVKGSVVMIKEKILDDETCELSSIEFVDTINAIRQRLINKGLIVFSDGRMSDFNYENITNSDKETFRIEIFGLCLFVCIDKVTCKDINKKLNRILNQKIYGDAYIHAMIENTFIDIDNELFLKIDALCWGDINKRNLTENEMNQGKMKGTKLLLMNPLRIIDRRFGELNIDIRKFVCSGCYRKKYNNLEEQNADWNNHKKECSYKKPSLNIKNNV